MNMHLLLPFVTTIARPCQCSISAAREQNVCITTPTANGAERRGVLACRGGRTNAVEQRSATTVDVRRARRSLSEAVRVKIKILRRIVP